MVQCAPQLHCPSIVIASRVLCASSVIPQSFPSIFEPLLRGPACFHGVSHTTHSLDLCHAHAAPLLVTLGYGPCPNQLTSNTLLFHHTQIEFSEWIKMGTSINCQNWPPTAPTGWSSETGLSGPCRTALSTNTLWLTLPQPHTLDLAPSTIWTLMHAGARRKVPSSRSCARPCLTARSLGSRQPLLSKLPGTS